MRVLKESPDSKNYKGYLKDSNKEFWCGSVSLIDGTIEETHTYEEAAYYDFHHSFYFSDSQIEKMGNGENAFFWVDGDGSIQVFREYGNVPNKIIDKIKAQIRIQ